MNMTKLILIAVLTASAVGCKQSGNSFSNVLGEGGGTGTASIAITSASPSNTSVTVKSNATQDFIVAATGTGSLTYRWTLDGADVGGDLPTFTLNGADYSVTPALKTLKVTISDTRGSTSHEWSVKINGSPSQTAKTPSITSYQHRQSTNLAFSVTYTDPNNDTLTYTWKLDGQEGVLGAGSNTSAVTYSPSSVDVGTHQISVDVRDGAVSDAGTFTATQTWTVVVNNFNAACNTMENESQTNKTCVHVGIANHGDGENPDSSPTSIYVRPASLKMTAEGNLFIGDDNADIVYFWNRASSPSATVLGVTVPINTIKVVAGVGVGGSGNSSSTLAVRQQINDPHGLEWDGSNLYIAEASNNRIVKVDSSGVMSNVLTAGCTSPRGLALSGTNLYVACYSNHTVRRIDTGTLASSIFFGTGAAGDPPDLTESSPTDATRGRLRGPYGVAVDASGNLYVGEYDGCRVRMVNNSGGAITLYGTYSISNNSQRIILGPAGAAACSYAAGEAVALTATADARIDRPRLLSISGNVLFVPNNSNHGVTALNLSATPVTFGAVSVPAYESVRIIGNGTAGYLGDNAVANTTRFNTPFQVLADVITSGDLFVADYSNLRLRKVKASDHRTELVAGNGGSRSGTNGNGTLEVGIEKFNQPRGLIYDSVNKLLFVADSSNHRIRSINRYGESSQAAGLGVTGSGSEENELPSIVSMNGPRGLTLTHSTSTFGGHLVWADTGNHRIRIWNRALTQQTLFGVTVDAGRVATIGGDGTTGNATSGSALTNAFNNPSGVTFDGTNLFVSDTSNHCIKKIDSTGNLSVAAGTCGTAGNVNGAAGTGRLNNPEKVAYYSSGSNSGLFIADRANSRIRFLRLTGSGAVAGVPVPVGDANTVFCGGTYHDDNIIPSNSICAQIYDVTVAGNNVCFSNYTYHNVRCVNLSTSLINTVLGPLQGVNDTTPTFFPMTSFSSSSQNGVTAAPGTTPAIGDTFGAVAYPITVGTIDSTTLVVGEYSGQNNLIRRVKLP